MNIVINNKYGIYFLLRYIDLDPRVFDILILYSKQNLMVLAHLEFACRVMRNLAEKSRPFRLFVMNAVKNDLTFFTKTPDSRYLVICGIMNAESEEERDVVTALVSNEHRIWSSNRNVKLVLMTYIEKYSEEKLDQLYRLLRMDRCFYCYLHDRDSCQVLLRLISRRHKGMINDMMILLTSDVYRCVKGIFFGYLIGEMLMNKEVREVSYDIDKHLRSVDDDVMRQLSAHTATYLVYCGAVSIFSLVMDNI